MVAGVQSSAEVATLHAGRYLQQLAKHFQYKRPVAFEERSGHIAFSGLCRKVVSLGVFPLFSSPIVSGGDDDQLQGQSV